MRVSRAFQSCGTDTALHVWPPAGRNCHLPPRVSRPGWPSPTGGRPRGGVASDAGAVTGPAQASAPMAAARRMVVSSTPRSTATMITAVRHPRYGMFTSNGNVKAVRCG